MKKPYLLYNLAVIFTAAFALAGCHKENGIDNNAVIKKPYGVYFGDDAGVMYNTTNGDDYKILPAFGADGTPARSIVTSGNNLIFAKVNVHLAINGSNPGNWNEFDITKNASWQPILIDVPDHKRVYMAADASYGVKYSEDTGKSWKADDNWNSNISNPSNIRITSFTQVKGGTLFAYDHVAGKLYKRDGLNAWDEITVNDLPVSTGIFYLSHIGNVLLATDFTGTEGVWHSENNGQNWTQYSGLPSRPLYATYAPFDERVLVGTDSFGVYKLAGNSFVPVNGGLADNTVVLGIAGKNDIYKNDIDKRYYYIATNTGLYRSEDQGQNWKLAKPGSFTAIY